ncbi:MAG: mechanosensitive ion channel [Clostridia bacterium]|nr:mechanosensitive ion channel [Clostridia bacterium]
MNFQINDWKSLVNLGIIIGVAIAVMILLIYINRKCFKRLKQKHQNLHLQLLEKLINVFIVIVVSLLAFSAMGGTRNVWQTLLGGTAVLSAVAAFAAQDVIRDMLAGLMISLYKPFDIGDRIELEDGTAGIVKDMTMRHVVINTIDTIKEVIPNSKLNVMQIKNYSFKADCRSVHFIFPVGYDSDPQQVKRVIAEAISQSEYSVPFRTGENGEKVYSDVYFLSLSESALEMSVTVYYNTTTPTEVVRDDINTRVKQALKDHQIEIPYNYINIIQK